MNDRDARVAERQRLDVTLVELGLAESREKARALIMAGSVLVDEVPAVKPGQIAPAGSQVRVREELPYVSRGGLKLAAALDAFALDPAGLAAADVGASTGGFTDCLLQRGAARVYAIDVGYGQLAWKLRQDPRVIVLERTNVRALQALPDAALVELAVVDVSFIGLDLVLPAVARWLSADGQAVVLIKPQFEAGKGRVGKGGVVRDPALHREILLRVLGWAAGHSWAVAGLIRSPITGPKGNVEFLALLSRRGAAPTPDVAALVDAVLAPEMEE
jgi:23S rRNA (cytidine1920-2'-O)/16S rRNA (cytidine1409-2'-O)-methyltransferase